MLGAVVPWHGVLRFGFFGMKDHISTMGWNPPSQGPQGSGNKDARPQGEKPRNGESTPNDDPWGRLNRNNAEGGINQLFKKAGKVWKSGNGGGKRAGSFKGLITVALIVLVGLNTSAERMALYASDAEGYVYVISSMGTTGVREHIAPEVDETMIRARKSFSLPLALGFGLKDPAQLDALHKDARPDAVVFGSALLQHLDAGLPAADFIRHWV